MKILEGIFLASKDVKNRKGRSILTIIAISVGSMLLVAMLGLGDTIKEATNKMVEGFGNVNVINVMPKDSSLLNNMKDETDGKLTDMKDKKILKENIEAIAKISGVDYVKAYIQSNFTGLSLEENNFIDKSGTAIGFSMDYNKSFGDEVILGENTLSSVEDIIIGEGLLKKLNVLDSNNIIGKKLKVKVEFPEVNGVKIKDELVVEGKVIGIIEKKSQYGYGLIMSDKKVEIMQGYFTDNNNFILENGYSSLDVYAKKGQNVGELAAKITKDMGYLTFSFDMIAKMLDVMTGVVKGILSLGGIIVLIVASLGLVNTMTMTLQEKKVMIGVMRAVGANRGNIKTVFIFQSVILGFVGAVLGVVFASIGIGIVNKWVISGEVNIPITLFNVSISIIITTIVSIVAGLLPSSKAAKLNVVNTLSAE